jgi:transposase
MRPSGRPEELEHRRNRAIQLLGQGLQPVEVARRVGADRRSVRRWKAAYRVRGAAGIKARPAPGRPSRLKAAYKQRLVILLERGAQTAGFSTDLWTCPRIAKLIRDRFDVSYHVDHVCRLLHSLGLSPQRPERRAIERDEDQIQNWVRTDWPRAKKKPAG